MVVGECGTPRPSLSISARIQKPQSARPLICRHESENNGTKQALTRCRPYLWPVRQHGAINPAARLRIRNIMLIARDYSRASQSFLFAHLTRANHDFIPRTLVFGG